MEASKIEEQVKLSLKLIVHKETNKVLFANVDMDFVNVLISFLTLPLGKIARLAAKESDMGPLTIALLSSLYQSVVNLGNEDMLKYTCKKMLLRPRNPMEDYCKNLVINIDDTWPTEYYVCDDLVSCRHKPKVMCSSFKNIECSCGNLLNKQILPRSFVFFYGFVNYVSCFMVTDDLCILPMSLDAKFSIIRKMGIEDMSSLEEIVVDVTENKLIDLLKCALVSKTPLTDVFLRKKFCFQESDWKIVSSDLFEGMCTPVKVNIMYKKSNGKVVCAQGKEDFANFLLSILTFPIGAVIRLLQGNSCMGSFDRLYKSVVDLSEDCFETPELKAKLVEIGLAPQFKLSKQVLPISEFKGRPYFCVTESCRNPNGTVELTDFYLDPCFVFPNGKLNNVEMVNTLSEGFVRGPKFYVATDELVVAPISSVSAISLLNNMNTKLSDIEEKEVNIGLKEGLNILKALLTSSTALTGGLAHLLTKVEK